MNDKPRRWVGLIAAAFSTLVIVTLFASSWERLPEPMATHWPLQGGPDGSMPRLVISAALTVVPWGVALAALLAKSRQARASLLTITFIFSAFFSVIAWSLVTLNRGADDWREAASIPWYHLLVLLGFGVGPGLAARQIYRPYFTAKDAGAAPALSLTAEQRAVWLGSAHNHWLWLLAALPLVAATFTSRASTSLAVTTSAVAVATLFLADAFSMVRVKVDRNGVTITCGHLGLVRRKVPLADINHAEVFDLVPMAHGGWGYRGSLWLMKRAAIVVRGGSALRLALQSGRELSVTVDDAVDAASLINGMVRLR